MSNITTINESDSDWTKHSYLFSVGTGGGYAAFHFLVYSNDMCDALDELGDYIAEHAPGLLYDKEEVYSTYRSNIELSGMNEEQAWEEATMDLIQCGNAGDCFFADWEVSYQEDPNEDFLDTFEETTEDD